MVCHFVLQKVLFSKRVRAKHYFAVGYRVPLYFNVPKTVFALK